MGEWMSEWGRAQVDEWTSKHVVGWLQAQLEGQATAALSNGLWEKGRRVVSEERGGP